MKKKGFTLIELIIVIVILVILALIAIPVVSKYVVDASKNTCDGNLATLSRSMENIKIIYSNEDIAKVFTYALEESNARCPSNGDYRLARLKKNEGSPFCEKHTKDVAIGESYYFATDIIADMKKNPKKYGLDADWKLNSNDQLTSAILKYYDFGKLKIGDKNYFIEPYYDEKSKSILVFAKAKEDYTSSDWYANYIYNPNDSKWYASPKGISVAHTPADKIYERMVSESWQQVSNPTEIRATKK